jgi:hypothetical protein
MRALEWSFNETASLEHRQELQERIEQARSLDQVFDFWFVERGNRLGLSFSVDDSGKVNDERIVLFFDTEKGNEVGSVDLSRSEVLAMYPDAISFNSFVKGWTKRSPSLELHEEKYESWLGELGFIDSYALMSRIGPRGAAIPLMLSFALSKGGVVEARHIDEQQLNDEDYKADLEEEGIDLNQYFHLYASYIKDPESRGSMRTMFDPVYCRMS